MVNCSFVDYLRSRNLRRPSTASACLLSIASILAMSGCGEEDHPETVPVAGSVLYDGSPLSNGKVMFNPVDSQNGRVAQGEIRPDGTFVLSTYEEGDGARPGDYNVSVYSFEPGSGGLERDKDLGLNIGDKSAIPEKFNDPKTSGINVSVQSGEPQADLKLDLKEK